MKTLDHTVQATSGRAAAVTRSTPAGSGITCPAGTATRVGVAAAGEQRAHLVADLPARRRPWPTAATVPLHSRPRCRRRPGGGG